MTEDTRPPPPGGVTGVLRKMRVQPGDPVSYHVPLGDELAPLDTRPGNHLSIVHTGNIFCTACGRKTSKSFSQGYCFPCFKSLAECDLCIMRPETCHYHAGTCRDPAWADGHCMQDHVVYLANSSGLKVGITRRSQVPTRWIDQGATQAMPIFRVRNRFHSGLVEAVLKKRVSDRTDWRRMLKGEAEKIDLGAAAKRLLDEAGDDLERLAREHGLDLTRLDEKVTEIRYPVHAYPEKVTSLSLDKSAEISGRLDGVKGQYLILDGGVLNVRKFTGYEVTLAQHRDGETSN